MREQMKSTQKFSEKTNGKKVFIKWGRSRDSNPSPGIHSPGG